MRRYPCSVLRLGRGDAWTAASVCVIGVGLVAAGTACGGSRHAAPLQAPRRVARVAAPVRIDQSAGRTFVVAPGGSDSAPGTARRPWRTIQKALSTLHPGQRALVRRGTYVENLVMQRAGTAARPITVENYPGERPVLRAAGTGAMAYPLRVTAGAAYFRFRGFVVEGAPLPTTVNIWVSDRQERQPRAAHDIEIADCEIRDGRGSGLLVSPNTSDVRIVGNVVHDNGRGTEQHQGIYFQGQSGLIARNVVYRETGGFGIQVRGSPENGIAANDILVTQNTTADNYLSGIVVENSASNVTVVNNISAYNGGWAIRGYDNGSGTFLPGDVAYHNLGYANRSGEYGNSGGPVVDFFPDNVVADPLFVAPEQHDYHLRPGSPAIGAAVVPTAGAAAGGPTAGSDLGAYELKAR